ncbi:fibronectin type III domain-containing protein [bacterium]|nr:fibronectin type III domain-containing protein [bacterium]MBU1753762.1 fibronectin type III domain-containing protein [bacterium]
MKNCCMKLGHYMYNRCILWLLFGLLLLSQASFAAPSQIKKTNITGAAFTISWITDSIGTGAIRYGIGTDSINILAADNRLSSTHHVVIEKELSPNTTYYYDIIYGGSTDDNHGQHYQLTTGKAMNYSGSDSIYGHVYKTDGSCVADAIVYVQINDLDGTGSVGSSSELSAVVKQNGSWFIDLINVRTNDLSSLFDYSSSGDSLSIFVQAGIDGTSKLITDIANASPCRNIRIDITPPCKINFLPVGTSGVTSVSLNWSSPGNDGYYGTAAGYEIRYATTSITESNWLQASIASGTIPSPEPAGTSQQAIINNLVPETGYYFAIKAYDEAGNWSELSNLVVASTLVQLSSVTITTAAATVEMLGTQSFTAQALNYHGVSIEDAAYTWTLEPAGIGTLNTTNSQTVMFTPTKTGTVNLQVTAGFKTQNAAASLKITIVNGMVCSVNIEQAIVTIEAKGTASFTAKAYNQYGYELTEVTNLDWKIIHGSGTIKNGSGKTIVLETNNVVGTLTLIASANTITGTATAMIIYGSVTSVSITPYTVSIEVGGTASFTAKAYNQYGYELTEVTNLDWKIIHGSRTIKNGSGKIIVFETNDVVGTLTLIASADTITGTATAMIIYGSVTSVSITPDTASIEVMGTNSFTVSAFNQFEHPIPASELIYNWGLSGMSGTFTPTATDTVAFTAGSKTGKVYITAGVSGKTATVTITLTPGAIKQLVFIQPATAGTLTVGMPGTITVQTQDEYGNVSPAGSITIIVNGNTQSRFALFPFDTVWTETDTFPLAGTSNLTFFFKQNGIDMAATITAAANNLATATMVITIELLGSQTTGQIIADDGRTKLEIGTGTLIGTGYIEITSTVDTTTDQTAINAANTADDVDKRTNRVKGTLQHFNPQGGVSATLTTTGTITISYNDQGNDAAGNQIREDRLKIYQLTQVSDGWQWIEIPNSKPDIWTNTISVPVTYLSYFILMCPGFEVNLNQVIVYPNPNLSDKHDCNIYFDMLTENSTIKIFTIAGELVQEIKADSSRMHWNTCNESGEKVASGIYVYFIKDAAGNKKTGKLGVIR